MTLDLIALQLFNALSLSSILLLIALGLSVTFGMMGVINFAHGEFLMIGAYTVFLCVKGLGADIGFLVALPMAFLVSAGLGYLLEFGMIRFLYSRPLESILATWGLSLIMQQGARSIFGANNVDIPGPSWLAGSLSITSSIQLPYARLFIILIAAATLLGMYFLIYRSSRGKIMQAVMQNRSMSACMGINTRRADALTFALGSGLAGLAGCAVSLLGSIGPSTGQNYIIDAFMVVVMGGVGSLAGTVAGSLMMGIASPFFEFITTSSMGRVIVFILVILFLQLKPSGLYALRTRST